MAYFSKISCILSTCLSFAVASAPLIAEAMVVKGHEHSDQTPGPKVPTGKGWGEKSLQAAPQPVTTTAVPQYGINYHNGPVMGATSATIPNIYVIWYGNWSNNTGVALLTDLLKSIGGTKYFGINSTYTDAKGNHIINAVNYIKSANDNYSQGTALTDAQVQQIVASKISQGTFPADTNGIYFVLTSADVNETSGFCTQYCGWHTAATIQNKNIKYAFVGNADRCLNSCAAQSTSPNNNPGADAMASVISHELEEATTDPNLNAWFNTSTGEENADQCAWTFGTTATAGNGSMYNMIIHGKQYLIQQNWLNAIVSGQQGACVKSFCGL